MVRTSGAVRVAARARSGATGAPARGASDDPRDRAGDANRRGRTRHRIAADVGRTRTHHERSARARVERADGNPAGVDVPDAERALRDDSPGAPGVVRAAVRIHVDLED